MKKVIYILLLVPIISFGQVQVSGQTPTYANPNPQPIKIEVTKNKDYETQQNERINANAAAKTAEAAAANARANTTIANVARASAMSEPSTKIKKSLTVDLNNYTHIAIVRAITTRWYTDSNGNSRWLTFNGGNRAYNSVKNALSISELTVLNPREVDKKKWKKNNLFLMENKNPNWLYVDYKQVGQGVNLISSLIIRNSKNNVLYSATHTNVATDEAMSIFQDMGLSSEFNSNVTEKKGIDRDEAIKRIKEAKDLFDTGILSQQEYDELVKKYKEVIMKN